MNRSILLTVVVLLALGCAVCEAAPPNIVFVPADDK